MERVADERVGGKRGEENSTMKGCYRECLAHSIDETHEGTNNVDSTTSCASTIHLRKGRDTNCDMRERSC